MTRLLWIPVAGTIAALVAIVLANPEREDEPAPFPPLDATPDNPLDEPAIDEPDTTPPPDERPDATPAEPVLIELRKDGSFGVVGEDTTYKDAAALIEAYGGAVPKPAVFLSNATKDVDRETLAKAADALRGKLDVRLDFREGDG